jgi:hypothetical protein
MAAVRFAWGLPIVISMALLLCPSALWAQESPCEVNVLAKSTSPDGRFTAALETINCGGRSVAGLSFSIHKNGSNESMAGFELTGTTKGKIKWDGNSKVVVLIPTGSDVNWHGTIEGYPEVYIATLQPNESAP